MWHHVRRMLVVSLTGSAALALAWSEAPAADPTLRFTDVTVPSGLEFRHVMGDDQMTNIVEASGVGCAWLDFDNDGWLDIYLVNGVHRDDVSDPRMVNRESLRNATDRLYRNRGDGTFEDVTERAGIRPGDYGMGVAVADYDDDGLRDLYVTNYGPNRLYHNLGNGRFEEVAEKAGVADSDFGVGSVFVDIDGDGRLDLYVGNYLDYVPDFNTADGFPGPTAYQAQINRLFRNMGGGQFQDVTQEAGFDKYAGHTMGVGMIDYNDDGRWDLFVANDAMENFFFENQGDFQFEENALLTSVAYGADGDARGSMGAEVGDVNGDGKFDLFVPDFTQTCLYVNQGEGFFEDQARQAGIAQACARYISWGAALADLDLDTDLDIYVSNGDARQLLAQPDLVFVNDGRGLFREVGQEAGLSALRPRVSRGVAAADMDNDGDLDLLITNLNDQPVLLRNDTPRQGRHWLMVDLAGRADQSNRDAIGAIVTCRVAQPQGGSATLIRLRTSSGSYMSVHDQRLHFGLGMAEVVAELTVRWPDGTRQTLHDVKADQVLRLTKE
ncbi:MAG: CRTAC1 family protein [Pirellulaceae bacterium]